MKNKKPNQNRRGQFLPRSWVISLILFSGIVGLAVLMVASLATEYNNTDIINPEIEENYANLQESAEIASKSLDQARTPGGFSILGAASVAFQASFAVFALILNSISITSNHLLNFGSDFGVPSEVSTVLFTMLISSVTVIIVFSIISVSSRRDF